MHFKIFQGDELLQDAVIQTAIEVGKEVELALGIEDVLLPPNMDFAGTMETKVRTEKLFSKGYGCAAVDDRGWSAEDGFGVVKLTPVNGPSIELELQQEDCRKLKEILIRWEISLGERDR